MYECIEESFSGEWELILVTECELPAELKEKTNIKVIFSERAPMQKQQQGLVHATGEFVTVISDDSVFLPSTLDQTFNYIASRPNFDYKTIVVLKYLEGIEHEFPEWYLKQVPEDMRFKTNWDFMRADKYYWSDSHESSAMIGIPWHSPILSCAIISRQVLFEVGGWDAVFQSQAMGNIDLSARLMKYGCTYHIQDLIVSTCGYMKQDTGDHGPIHYAQLEEDEPLLKKMYGNDFCKDRIIIDLNNWEASEPIWKRKKGRYDA